MNIIIRRLTKEDYNNLDKFYVMALEEEHKALVFEEDIKEFLHNYEKGNQITYWFENNDCKAFIALDNENRIIGFLTAKYFDRKDSIIFSISILSSDIRDRIRDEFLKKLREEFPNIKDMFIDVYEKNNEEVKFFTGRGFIVWETSTAPVGEKMLNVHLMQKVL